MKKPHRPFQLIVLMLGLGISTALVGYLYKYFSQPKISLSKQTTIESLITPQGLTKFKPSRAPSEVWECEVVVVGGSLGGVAAAENAMRYGAKTCLIELAPWLGGQISSGGVSALDESLAMRAKENYSKSWIDFKKLIKQQPVELPAWSSKISEKLSVADINSCWVAKLCFPPKAGAVASEKLLQSSSKNAPGSRWSTSTAFKGAAFDSTGKQITAIYAVRRIPRDPKYMPSGRLSKELNSWYSWTDNKDFQKVPLRLQAPANGRMMVIDATDTGELVGWSGIPQRLGSESKATTGEIHAAPKDNPQCTQAFTYPFVLALRDDGGLSRSQLVVNDGISKEEHRRDYLLENFPMFTGRSFFNYRRIVSSTDNDPFVDSPQLGDMTLVNWNRGNDWKLMNPPLILTQEQITNTGQRQNWMGGISTQALMLGENNALHFADWLIETQTKPGFPLAYLSGEESLMGTKSGLSMVPYIREGRRILGRSAYGQNEFMMREADIRTDVPGGRNFQTSVVGVTHYDIDIHGCRYRNWEPSNEATKAPAREFVVRPVLIPLESLIPQKIDNLLIGGKSIAVTHIVNAVTRVHYGEWTVGAAAGVTAAWLVTEPNLTPSNIIEQQRMPQLQQILIKQGLRLSW